MPTAQSGGTGQRLAVKGTLFAELAAEILCAKR